MSKRILITGINQAQTQRDFYLRQQLQVVPSHYGLIRCLEDMGWEVDQRSVTIGEDLSGYDEVIVYIHNLQSFAARIWSGLWTISQRPDCILAFDDWQFKGMIDSIVKYKESIIEDIKPFRKYLFDHYGGDESEETIKEHAQDYIDGCTIVENRNNRLLVSAFAGGDLDLMDLGWQKDKLFTFNPNPYHLNRRPDNNFEDGTVKLFTETVYPEEKQRKWNFASLLHRRTRRWLKDQNDDWKWEIDYFGQKNAGKNDDYKSERLKEYDMCRVYEKQWGCLMPGYHHAGSGWWRARPLQVADVGSILICDDAEGKVYGDAYVGLTAAQVEAMTLEQLVQAAKDQHDCLYDNHPLDKNVTQKELEAILNATK